MRDPNKQAKIDKRKAEGAGKQCETAVSKAEHVCSLIEVPGDCNPKGVLYFADA